MSVFDYIIIGAGAAGCTLANRLGEDLTKSILVIEAGPMDWNLMIHIPAGVYSAWRNPRLNWNYVTDADPKVAGRGIEMPRGRVLGGSTSINSMVYMRGHPKDYDRWASEHGLVDWTYRRCLPYFRAGETFSGGADDWRGGDGPLGVTKSDFDNPLYDAFVEAGGQAGQGQTRDPSGFQPEGVARLDATKRWGRRSSAAVAHLRPALKRGNVTLLTRAMVQKIQLERARAVAVEVRHRGRTRRIEAGHIILSGGALNSPQTLMLSGIGPADHLRSHGITPLVDLPGVGQNLQDHATVIMEWESLKSFPIHRVDHPLRKGLAGAQWVFTRKGMASSSIWEAGGLIRGNHSVDYANLQYHFAPVGAAYDGNRIQLNQSFALHIDLLRPRSRGAVRLRSANPCDKPSLAFNYFDVPEDLAQLVEGVHKARALVAQPAFDGLRGAELAPSANVTTDADIAAWIRTILTSDFHPSGTCRMGHCSDAVVDDHFAVRGVQGLSVVDASIMPAIPSGNLNAPTQMIAARAADIIANRPPLPPEAPAFAFQT